MLDFNVSILGKDVVQKRLAGLQSKIKNLTPAWKQIQQDFFKMEQEQFSSRGQGAWPELSPTYRDWKAKHAPGQPLMVLTGALRESLTGQSSDSISIIRAQSAEFGTQSRSRAPYIASGPYAKWHQEGKGKLPQRKLIAPTQQHIDNWVKLIQKHLVGSAGSSYGGISPGGLI